MNFLLGRYLNVAVNYGDRVFGEYPLAQFFFADGEFRGITLIKRTSAETWDYIDKRPGEEPVVGGVQSLRREEPSPPQARGEK